MLVKQWRKFWNNQSGSMATEAAFTLPAVFLVIVMVIEVGRMAYTQAVLFFAVQEATRVALVANGTMTDDQIADFASTKLLGLDPGNVTSIIAVSPDAGAGTQLLSITINYQFDFLVPIVPGMHSFTLDAASRGFLIPPNT